jgi:sugar lactone lactonase YvrE
MHRPVFMYLVWGESEMVELQSQTHPGWSRCGVGLLIVACILGQPGCGGDDCGSRQRVTSATSTPTGTATPIASNTPILTATAPPFETPTSSPTTAPSATVTPTVTATATVTLSPSPTASNTPSVLIVSMVNDAPASAPAATRLAEPLTVRVTNGGGLPLAGVEVEFSVRRGGGSVEPESAFTSDDGTASATWTLGVAPVSNRLRARAAGEAVRFDTLATLEAPYAAEGFGDVNEFMTEQGIAGSTEDLAFQGGRFVLGVPGGLLQVDAQGVTSAIALTGDPLVGPLGVAFDQNDDLWVADSAGHALRKVSPAGEVTTVLTDDGSEPLSSPNYVAIDAAGRVYLSDPCRGELLRYDPATATVDAVLRFDLPNEGGPNGFAFDGNGERLYIATENTSLFCQDPNVGLTDAIAGLFSVEVSADGFGERQDLATRMALFGDGVAVDREGNVYVVFDTEVDLMLEESAVWVLPNGETELVKFLSASDRVFANLAFGRSDFGNRTLYLSLLTIPNLIPPDSRGLNRFETGIRGVRVPPLAEEEPEDEE